MGGLATCSVLRSGPNGGALAKETVPFDAAPRFLLRDGDAIYGDRVQKRIVSSGSDEVVTAPASPWQKAEVERVIGSLRRELLDRVLIINERHLKRLLSSYLQYYWSDFVLETYVYHRFNVIFLKGLPDVAESHPHSDVNS